MSRPLTMSEVKKMAGVKNLQKVRCSRQDMYFKSTQGAMDYFMDAINGCDPHSSECSRYVKIYTDLACGRTLPSDEDF